MVVGKMEGSSNLVQVLMQMHPPPLFVVDASVEEWSLRVKNFHACLSATSKIHKPKSNQIIQSGKILLTRLYDRNLSRHTLSKIPIRYRRDAI